MKYVELTINTTSLGVELVADKLWEFTEYGVSICDDNDILELINKRRNTWDYLEDSLTENLGSRTTLVKCYLDLDTADTVKVEIEKALNEMKERAGGEIPFGSLEIISRIVDGDDWIEIWRKHYRPMDMGKVVICPEWINYTPKQGQQVVIIDSNQAFGTGEHETTSMCIDFLSMYVKPNMTVIDVGTGSGILGITAVKLGATKSIMTDIDEVAVETAKHNAEINKVKEKCNITLDNLLEENDGKGEIVVANITADILCVLSKDILKHTLDNGIVICSGILKDKAQMVVDNYTQLGLKLINSKSKGEWVALVFERV